MENKDNKIKAIALSYKRGIRTEMEAWTAIADVYTEAGLPCDLGDAEYILEYFLTLV